MPGGNFADQRRSVSVVRRPLSWDSGTAAGVLSNLPVPGGVQGNKAIRDRPPAESGVHQTRQSPGTRDVSFVPR